MPALVTRTAAGRTSTPEEGVDRVVALKMFTYSNAESMLAEDFIGSLEPGKFADFAVLLNNWLEGPDSELGVNKVIMTVVGDEIIYEDRNTPWESGEATAAR
jgi:predicted amidohydrolase YtcJ